MTTKELRAALYNYLSQQGTYICHEVEIPIVADHFEKTGIIHGRVDMLSYEKPYKLGKEPAVIRCYELKISKEDFHSINGHNFIGNYNYYVVPPDLYPKIKDEIPDGIGCLVPYTQLIRPRAYGGDFQKGDWTFKCVKKPKRRELLCDYDLLINNFICALSRECCIKNVGRYKARRLPLPYLGYIKR